MISLPLKTHLVLVGFKHAGKSTIGKKLAEAFNVPFIDLDNAIEAHYYHEFNTAKTCRDIMRQHGETFFRELETTVLQNITVVTIPHVIALGGGASLSECNQTIIKPFVIVHVTAPKSVIFKRIKATGLPAFCKNITKLNALWKKQVPIYKKICHFSIKNKRKMNTTISSLHFSPCGRSRRRRRRMRGVFEKFNAFKKHPSSATLRVSASPTRGEAKNLSLTPMSTRGEVKAIYTILQGPL